MNRDGGALRYQLRLREHLARYKREALHVDEDGTWGRGGTARQYPHILPADRVRLNVVRQVREEFWDYWERERRTATPPPKLHRYFAHLTSSQALAFNVFFPFLGSAHAEPPALLAALGLDAASPVAAWRFEAIEDEKEGTNFDVRLMLEDGRRVVVEVKLSESKFGVCRDDARHREKLDGIYIPRLRGKVVPVVFERRTFFGRYQILRNVSYAGADTEVVFLVPRANESLRSGVDFLGRALLPDFRERVRVVYLEDLLPALAANGRSPALRRTMDEIVAKYVLPARSDGHTPEPSASPSHLGAARR